MKLKPEQRTSSQNKALHLYFTQLAEELNGAGLDMRQTLKPEIAIPWTPETIKEYLWRPVQKAQLQKQSTTKLTSNEVTQIYETLNRHFSERFGVYVPFPSIESLTINNEKINTRNR